MKLHHWTEDQALDLLTGFCLGCLLGALSMFIWLGGVVPPLPVPGAYP